MPALELDYQWPSEDIWNKFDIPITTPKSPKFSESEILDRVSELLEGEGLYFSARNELSELRHDCMWAGTCPSDEHKTLCVTEDSNWSSVIYSPLSPLPQSPLPGLPLSPDSGSDGENTLSSDDQPNTPLGPNTQYLVDHSYHSTPDRSFAGLPTPPDSGEEEDYPVKRNMSVKRQLQLAVSAIQERNNSNKKNQNETVEVRITAIGSSKTFTMTTRNKSNPSVGNAVRRATSLLQPRIHKRKRDTDQSNSSVVCKKYPKKQRAECNSSDEEPGEKKNHNHLERQRRVDLRNSFDLVRSLVPALRSVERTPKVNILMEASQYCSRLTVQNDVLEMEKEKQLAIRERLQRRLLYLQSLWQQ